MHACNSWSALGRAERYRNRCGDEGVHTDDPENPLPGFIDPITLQPVVTPAVSPLGHVMGLATWKVHSPCRPLKVQKLLLSERAALLRQQLHHGRMHASIAHGSGSIISRMAWMATV